jgi:SHS2 domain-containing protein
MIKFMVEHKADLNIKSKGIGLREYFKNNKQILSALFDKKAKNQQENSSENKQDYWNILRFRKNFKYYHF